MVKFVSLDTGPISLYFTKEHSEKVDLLFSAIIDGKITAFIAAPVLTEVYKHLCVANGQDFANSSIVALLREFPMEVVSLGQSLIMKAGDLKCRFRKKLSYTDCYVIALALLERCEVHTTEKTFPKLANLKIVPYSF